MSNPVFNEKSMQQAAETWAPPVRGTHTATVPITDGMLPPPVVTDGPVTKWSKAMTVNGTITKSVFLFALLLITATIGWMASDGPTVTLENGQMVDTYQFPPLGFVGIAIGFAAVIGMSFRPMLAKFLGPLYALGYGFAVGAISRGYETFYDGIVVQAAAATIAVLGVMLVLYRTRIIKVTDKFRRTVIFATLGVMVLYVGSWIFSLFGGSVPFLNGDNMLFSIAFSVFVCVLAAANLALDFDLIERGTKGAMPQEYEWVAATGLVVTLVWLYLEILRLLSYLRN